RTVAAVRGTEPWVEQVVVDHGGRVRTLGAAFASRLRLRALEARLTTASMRGISAPRPDAAPPAHVGVVAPPRFGDEVARELRDTLAKVLTDAELACLAGCAVLGVDQAGVRLMGWHGDGDPATAAALAEGDPFGADDRRTPVVLAAAQPAKEPRSGKRGTGRKARRS
ncbi:MAG: hypothetical protein HOV79_27275, partial [Hamadaea sp.]|nr:hypothetical protein [Hamadaea sp.]